MSRDRKKNRKDSSDDSDVHSSSEEADENRPMEVVLVDYDPAPPSLEPTLLGSESTAEASTTFTQHGEV